MREIHPYGTFIPKGAKKMLIGSFPIGKFSHPKRRSEIKPHEIDFYFGGETNLLWRLLGDVFETKLYSKKRIEDFLKSQKMGVGDVIKSCVRREGRASDSDLLEIEWNTELFGLLEKAKIDHIYFTSKRVEKWFKRLFPGPYPFALHTLYSPSAQTARGLTRDPLYQKFKRENPQSKAYEFLLSQYKQIFSSNL